MALAARTVAVPMTLAEFLEHALPDARTELVRGELRVTPPPGAPHGVAVSNLVWLLSIHVRERALGRVFGDGVGYELASFANTVRVPDASFVAAGKLPADGVRPGLLTVAPDLAIEVLSPSETASEVEEKLSDYLTSGAAVWVVDPVRRTVMVVLPDQPVRWLGESDQLDGGLVVPGFRCAVSAIFEGIARQ